ncbi:MAG: hypothetical protein ABUL72_03490, partial [Armatimonadota bacterium]
MKNYFDGTKPRFDFVVAPNGDPSKIKMTYKASQGLKVDHDKLSVKTSIGDLVESDLAAYQIIGGKRKEVEVAFAKLDKDTIGFKVGKYDHSKTLVIDPLIYGSYYGGDSGMDEVHATISDVLGGTYLTGQTKAPDFPAIFGPYSFSLQAGQDAFVAKLQGDVYRHDYAAFLGGNQKDAGDYLQLDQFGNLWVLGRTTSTNFPGFSGNNVQYLAYDPNHSQALTAPNTALSKP